MKKILLFVLMAIITMGFMTAREKKTQNVKTTEFATDIHCEGCSTKIMNNVPALGKGIKDVHINLDNKVVTVTYDTTKNNVEHIINGFKSIGVVAIPIIPQTTRQNASIHVVRRKTQYLLTAASKNKRVHFRQIQFVNKL